MIPFGVTDGTRTRDSLLHKQVLYQLSYGHQGDLTVLIIAKEGFKSIEHPANAHQSILSNQDKLFYLSSERSLF